MLRQWYIFTLGSLMLFLYRAPHAGGLGGFWYCWRDVEVGNGRTSGSNFGFGSCCENDNQMTWRCHCNRAEDRGFVLVRLRDQTAGNKVHLMFILSSCFWMFNKTCMFLSLFFFFYSYLPWFEVYYKLLNTLADYLAKEQVSYGPPPLFFFFYWGQMHTT